MSDHPLTSPANPPCNVPLRQSDLQHYDVVPDDKLFLSELDQGRRSCFVSRYTHTDDKEVRIYFLKRLQYSLWEAIRDELATHPPISADKQFNDRMKRIVDYEFTNQSLRLSLETEVQRTGDREDTTADGKTYSFRKHENQVYGSGWASLKIPLSTAWRLSSDMALRGKRSSEVQEEISDGRVTLADYDFFGHKSEGSLSVLRLDEKAKWNLSGTWDRYYSPSPDHLESHIDASSGLEWRSDDLSLKASGSYLRERYAPPPMSSGYLQKRRDSANGYAESTMRMGAWEAVLAYSYTDDENRDHSYEEKTEAHSGSLLAQYTRNATYLRVGLGGGTWNGKQFFVVDAHPTLLDGRELHVSLSGKYQISEFLGLIGSAKINANKSAETFVGWYPSWMGKLTSELSIAHFSAMITYAYRGHRIDLDKSQQKDRHEFSLEAVYRPRDFLKIKVTSVVKYSDVRGYKSSDSTNGNLGVSASYNPVKFLWLWLYGGGYVADYHYSGGSSVYSGNWIGGGASLDY